MSDVVIKVRLNGPLLVQGPVTVVDHLGHPFPINTSKPGIALCRCGYSQNRPFCDGAHTGCGFTADESAPVPRPDESS